MMNNQKKSGTDRELLSDNAEKNVSRRNFMKKAAYSAPALIALGMLSKPVNGFTDSSVPPPPPGWNP